MMVGYQNRDSQLTGNGADHQGIVTRGASAAELVQTEDVHGSSMEERMEEDQQLRGLALQF
eukprot:5860705-Pyramimonas_sp.AAC.1